MPETWDVLVVDDEPVVRDAIRLVLEGEGLRVVTVPEGAAALSHPALKVCRLVLCDLMLPDLSGFEVVRGVRAQRPDLPVVVITGYPTSENAQRVVEVGASDFLPKPFTSSELISVVSRALHLENTARRRRTE